MTIPRFIPIDRGGDEAIMGPSPEGEWVRYSDVAHFILAAREKALADNEGFGNREQVTAIVAPALPLLERMATTYQERRAVYGPSEQKFADLCLALFPDGLQLKTKSDWVRFGLFFQMISKLARYAFDFSTGHIDSIHDLPVYGAMLEAEDRRLQRRAPFTLVNTDIR